MIRLRRLAIVLMAVGLITSAIYATGAFTNITAQRDANIRVAGDGGSYLSLQPANGSNGAYATQRGGQLRVSLGGALGEGGGAGVNRESLTVVRDVFTITNKGAQSLGVWVTDSSEAVTFEGGKKERTLEGKQQAVSLKPGDSVTVGLTIDTRQHKGDSVIKSVQIHADSDVSGAAVGGGSVGSGDQPTRKPTPAPQTKETPASASKDGDGSNSKYEKCAALDWGCHKRNAGKGADEAVNRITSGDLDGDGETLTKELTDSSNTVVEKGREYIRKFNKDIENVIDFLEKHPALAAVIMAALPMGTGIGAGIAVWAHENPEQATAFALGGVLGEMGMPKGLLEVSQSESPFYLLGTLGIATTPYVGVLADTRDFVQNGLSAITKQSWGDAGEAVLDLTGLVGSLSAYGVGDAPKVASVTMKWVSRFGSSPAVIKTMGKFLSSSASRAQIGVTLDLISDGSASVLLKRGESMDEVLQHAIKGDLKETAKILSKRPPSTGKITNDEYLYIVNKGYDEQLVNSMVKRGLSGNKMTKLVHSGVDLKKAKPLVKEGFSGDNIMTLAKKGVYPKTATPLAKQGATTDDILMLKQKGADVDLAAELVNNKVPLEHIKYYGKKGNDLDGVKWATERGYTPKQIKLVYMAKNNKKIPVDLGVSGSGFYTLANNYCNWQRQPSVDEKWKAQDLCQKIQVSPLNGNDTTKASS